MEKLIEGQRSIRTFGEKMSRKYFKLKLDTSVVVEALRYKPEVRGIDSRWFHWNLLLT
jgi:hypothetical protein